MPLTRSYLQIDLFARWERAGRARAPRRALGTINHTLLSLEALRRRAAFRCSASPSSATRTPTSERTIAEMGGVRRLGRLPLVDPLTPTRLRAGFAANFASRTSSSPVTT